MFRLLTFCIINYTLILSGFLPEIVMQRVWGPPPPRFPVWALFAVQVAMGSSYLRPNDYPPGGGGMRGAISFCWGRGGGLLPHVPAGGSFFLSHFHLLCFAPHISWACMLLL
jgi:hypothetical protein